MGIPAAARRDPRLRAATGGLLAAALLVPALSTSRAYAVDPVRWEQSNLAGLGYLAASGVEASRAPPPGRRPRSSCAVNVTGGTEVGHAAGTYSHHNGYKADINPNTCITHYIQANFTKIAPRGDGAQRWRSSAGNVHARESSHFDITSCGSSRACTNAAGS